MRKRAWCSPSRQVLKPELVHIEMCISVAQHIERKRTLAAKMCIKTLAESTACTDPVYYSSRCNSEGRAGRSARLGGFTFWSWPCALTGASKAKDQRSASSAGSSVACAQTKSSMKAQFLRSAGAVCFFEVGSVLTEETD